jgi:chromosome segregation ATPase
MEFTIEELSKRAADIQRATNELFVRYHEITSLQEAARWKSDALALQNLLTLYQQDLVQSLNIVKVELTQEENARKSLSFIKRFRARRDLGKKHKGNLELTEKAIESIETAKSLIGEKINETPANRAELKTILSGLNARKKELSVDKRSLNEEIRQIRTKARQDRAEYSGIGKMATYQRASITRGKERMLAPRESDKGGVENQVIEIEKKIDRLEGFKVDDTVNIESDVLRCSNCGRRVNSGELCPGCGSDKTTYELN